MVESASSKNLRITIVYDAPAQSAGRKEFFPSAEQLVRHFEEMDVAAVSDTIAHVCNGLIAGLGRIWSAEAPLFVDTLEFTLALVH
jgi:hypothetical protein